MPFLEPEDRDSNLARSVSGEPEPDRCLEDILAATGDATVVLKTGAVQVFPRIGKFGTAGRYYHLTDYVVSSAIGGPSLILAPRTGPIDPVAD